MVAPGDNLEFLASLYFRERSRMDPVLLDFIKQRLREDPNSGFLIQGDIKERDFDIQGEQFTLIFSRRANCISLLHIFKSDEVEALAAKKKHLVETRKKGGKP